MASYYIPSCWLRITSSTIWKDHHVFRFALGAFLAIGIIAAPCQAGLVVQYNFDGNAVDSSGEGNDGTIVGSPIFVSWLSGQAIFFNNPVGLQDATQYVALPNSLSILALQNWSLTVAIQYLSADTTINNGRLFGRDSGPAGSSFLFDVNSGAAETYVNVRGTNGVFLDTLPSVTGNPVALTSDGKWHWGVFVLDRTAGDLRQYVDAQLLATVPLAGIGPVLLSDLNIGRVSMSTAFGAREVKMDNFRLYDQPLTDSEVHALVHSTAVPEPMSAVLFGIGLVGLATREYHRRVRRTAAARMRSS